MRIPASLAVLIASVTLVAPVVAQEKAARTSEQAVLLPGDSIRVVVWRKPEFSGDFEIAPDGSITHPLYRAVQVAKVPFATAEANLRRFLSGFEDNPQFVMEPLLRVAVSGEVTRPQVFAVRPETTIGEALARAGGPNTNGARNRVRVLRLEPNGQQTQMTLDLQGAGSNDGTLPIRSGDQIVVDKKKSFARDILVPALGIIGSIASVGLLVDRINKGR
ncbi:MAG TPA: SLBB domain-containing protein [Gemmatimonadales bacterium]|nr:SLBB domain-containing protein [Gemmatimonadales bacterium]